MQTRQNTNVGMSLLLKNSTSGLNWDESYYSPFSVTTRAYFDDDLDPVMRNLGMKGKPGESYTYLSGNTQLLVMVLEKATGKKLANYLSDTFWKPLGSQEDALWQLDSEESGLVKAYCCIASNARDFARLGKLYKDYGKWNGTQILDSAFVAKSIKPRFEGEPYGYGFWLMHNFLPSRRSCFSIPAQNHRSILQIQYCHF